MAPYVEMCHVPKEHAALIIYGEALPGKGIPVSVDTMANSGVIDKHDVPAEAMKFVVRGEGATITRELTELRSSHTEPFRIGSWV